MPYHVCSDDQPPTQGTSLRAVPAVQGRVTPRESRPTHIRAQGCYGCRTQSVAGHGTRHQPHAPRAQSLGRTAHLQNARTHTHIHTHTHTSKPYDTVFTLCEPAFLRASCTTCEGTVMIDCLYVCVCMYCVASMHTWCAWRSLAMLAAWHDARLHVDCLTRMRHAAQLFCSSTAAWWQVACKVRACLSAISRCQGLRPHL